MAEGTINCPFVVHFHQPVGQLEHVLERIHSRSYELWVRAFERHPKVKFTVHFSGPLLEWIAGNHPEYIEKIRKFVGRGQLEIIGGAYYEPILPILPDEDKIAQIQLLSKFLGKALGSRPVGCWLAERVWEPQLPKSLAEAGVKYVLIDDHHLKRAGYREEETFHPYVTEEQGRRVAVFPINERLRYLLPSESLEKAIEYLNHARTPKGNRILLYFTDAEKYGEWIEPVAAERLLEKHLQMMEGAPWITPITLGEYLHLHPPSRLVYLPSASYDKMVEWSRGHFRNFLSRYDESNNMHKKMLYVREKIERAKALGAPVELLDEARIELYKGQCNDAYWHGMFGGIYLPFLRQAVYQHLIRAEVIAERALERVGFGGRVAAVVEHDFDYDGEPELLLESRYLNAYVKPSDGGNVFELDYKGKINHNFASTFTQREEAYHSSWSRKPALDWYRRTILRDHLLRPGLELGEFLERKPYFDVGDFTRERFEHRIEKGDEAKVRLFRFGREWSKAHGHPLLLMKVVSIPPDSAKLSAWYSLRNVGVETLDLNFAPEFALIPPLPFGASEEELAKYPCTIAGEDTIEVDLRAEIGQEDATGCAIKDAYNGIITEFSWGKPTELWLAPLRTMVQTDRGLEVIYQGTIMMPIFRIKLPRDMESCFNLSLRIIEE